MTLDTKESFAQLPEWTVISWNNILQAVKEQIYIITQNIPDFAHHIEPVKNYWDFERMKKEINVFLTENFSHLLKEKTPDFILGFEQGNISKYKTSHDLEKVDLMELLIIKNKFYIEILRNIVLLWKLDTLLNQDQKVDLIYIIESWVFWFLDELYLEWYKEIYDEKNAGIVTEKLSYGGVKDGKIVPLKNLLEGEIKIDDWKLSQIQNIHIREYLLAFSSLIKNGVTDYDTWVNAEIHEVKSWQDRKQIFWIVAPMEDYMYPWILVEPELIIFLKNSEKKVHFEDFYWLSERYFQDRFWMDSMTLDFVETLLQTGDAAFSGFIWKAFPNDRELSQREWNCIILKDTNMKNVVHNAEKGLKALLWEDFHMNFDTLYNELIKEVTYHEFGHSLFVKWHPTSLLEEAKATLFYYLQLYSEHEKKQYTSDERRSIVEFTLMDSIRNLERMNEASAKKYVILTQMNLAYLFESGLVYWANGNLVIDTTDEVPFYTFLRGLKDMLFMIQELYALDDISLQQEEIKILEKIERYVGENIQKMQEVLSK